MAQARELRFVGIRSDGMKPNGFYADCPKKLCSDAAQTNTNSEQVEETRCKRETHENGVRRNSIKPAAELEKISNF